MHCQPISRARFLDQNCDKLTDVQTRRRRTIQKRRSQACRSQVACDCRFCGVRLCRVCMSVSLSQFWSRNQLALSIALTVHYSPAVSRNRALTYTWTTAAWLSPLCSLSSPSTGRSQGDVISQLLEPHEHRGKSRPSSGTVLRL